MESAESAPEGVLILSELSDVNFREITGITPWRENWSLFNPSIASDGAGITLCLVRSSNYHFDGIVYSDFFDENGQRLTGDPEIKTQTLCATLDSDHNVLSYFWIATSDAFNQLPLFPVHGIEDMRLTHNGEEWIVTGTIRQHDEEGYCRQIIAKLDVENQRLVDLHIMQTPLAPWKTRWANVHEKNWLSLPSSPSRHRMVWSCLPLTTVEWDWATGNLGPLSGTASAASIHALRGSTPFIHTAQGLLGIAHQAAPGSRTIIDGQRTPLRYLSRFVLIEEETWTATYGEPFIFKGNFVEYASGISIAGEIVTISLGLNDASAHLLDIPLKHVLQTMETESIVH